MKNIIREFLEPSNEEKQELWDNSVFVFDTNTLLNLYRYSSNTRDILINALDYLKDRIWMPYQVAFEFMKNRCEVIYETIEHYDKMIQEKNKFKSTIANLLRLKDEDQDLMELDKYLNDWIEKQRQQNLMVASHGKDEILNNIIKLYDGKTGVQYYEERLTEIKIEGKGRYEKLIPPGYKDQKKENKSNLTDNNMYGDLIIWKQILDYSKSNKKNIIYVTDDQKEDWWNIVKVKTIGPRVELRKEFIEYTNQQFHMYSMSHFIKIYKERSGIKVEQSVIDEVSKFEELCYSDKFPLTYIDIEHFFDRRIIEESINKIDFNKLNNSKKLHYLKYNKTGKKRECENIKIEKEYNENQHGEFYIMCPRCKYVGYSEFENHCPKCDNIWCE